MKRPIVGLLPVDPNRLFVYWETSTPAGGGLSLRSACGSLRLTSLAPSGGHYFHNLEPRRSYAFELCDGGTLLALSNAVELPANTWSGPEPAPPSDPQPAPGPAPASGSLR